MEGTDTGGFFLDGAAFGGDETGAAAGALGIVWVLGGDLAGASDGEETVLRGGGTEVGALAGGALEMGGVLGAAMGASGLVSEGLGLATGATDFVAFLAAANATPTMAVSVVISSLS